MKNYKNLKIDELIRKGVKIPNPDSVEIGDEVETDNISGNGVVIYAGCKIYGGSTLISQNAKLGYEAPATIESCQAGPGVELKGGYFKQSIFINNNVIGAGAHIREGTIMEEDSKVAHTVGLKQTILFPFVTLGSLINFCDCFMSGGTGKKDHSEVGSSYIHFNFTPNQDKATPSIFGDVPKGVMLNQKPIFLGGQGGCVGPCRISFGTVTAAGTICRTDQLEPDHLVFERGGKGGKFPYKPGKYSNIKRIIINNIVYIANLIALIQWYKYIRYRFISEDFPQFLFEGLENKLEIGINERIKRLELFIYKIEESAEIYKSQKEPGIIFKQKKELVNNWPEIKMVMNTHGKFIGNDKLREAFLEKIDLNIKRCGKNYISVIKSLSKEESKIGTQWLQGIVDEVTTNILDMISSFK